MRLRTARVNAHDRPARTVPSGRPRAIAARCALVDVHDREPELVQRNRVAVAGACTVCEPKAAHAQPFHRRRLRSRGTSGRPRYSADIRDVRSTSAEQPPHASRSPASTPGSWRSAPRRVARYGTALASPSFHGSLGERATARQQARCWAFGSICATTSMRGSSHTQRRLLARAMNTPNTNPTPRMRTASRITERLLNPAWPSSQTRFSRSHRRRRRRVRRCRPCRGH